MKTSAWQAVQFMASLLGVPALHGVGTPVGWPCEYFHLLFAFDFMMLTSLYISRVIADD